MQSTAGKEAAYDRFLKSSNNTLTRLQPENGLSETKPESGNCSITSEQLTTAFKRVLGDAGVSLAARVSYATILGSVLAWYLLARGVMGLTRAAAGNTDSVPASTRRLIWQGPTRVAHS